MKNIINMKKKFLLYCLTLVSMLFLPTMSVCAQQYGKLTVYAKGFPIDPKNKISIRADIKPSFFFSAADSLHIKDQNTKKSAETGSFSTPQNYYLRLSAERVAPPAPGFKSHYYLEIDGSCDSLSITPDGEGSQGYNGLLTNTVGFKKISIILTITNNTFPTAATLTCKVKKE